MFLQSTQHNSSAEAYGELETGNCRPDSCFSCPPGGVSILLNGGVEARSNPRKVCHVSIPDGCLQQIRAASTTHCSSSLAETPIT